MNAELMKMMKAYTGVLGKDSSIEYESDDGSVSSVVGAVFGGGRAG
eukprot:CAMPEP_0118634846 /NCGR_PEP_ID=MMETSP0785-20121206/1764_1 /TAXON_ID=91992 /ORGANISM="Bolidomonas pacifica, Strain CCMP 1866" /LENGTH=45 /DNA_ID= /DNA_START= /DNA_END= /DNA_ORIENTATION=